MPLPLLVRSCWPPAKFFEERKFLARRQQQEVPSPDTFAPTVEDFTWHVRLHWLSKLDSVAVDNVCHGQDLHLYLAAVVDFDNRRVFPVADSYQFLHFELVSFSL